MNWENRGEQGFSVNKLEQPNLVRGLRLREASNPFIIKTFIKLHMVLCNCQESISHIENCFHHNTSLVDASFYLEDILNNYYELINIFYSISFIYKQYTQNPYLFDDIKQAKSSIYAAAYYIGITERDFKISGHLTHLISTLKSLDTETEPINERNMTLKTGYLQRFEALYKRIGEHYYIFIRFVLMFEYPDTFKVKSPPNRNHIKIVY